MALAKFGLKYENWTDEQLKVFAVLRGIPLPLFPTGRSLWINVLRAKDYEAMILFLSLLSEIRNTIYGLLLSPTNDDAELHGRICCHVAILATCKQVNTEAADNMFESACVPISFTLSNRSIIKPPFGALTDEYGTDIFLNTK